jgi:hypothetical protein
MKATFQLDTRNMSRALRDLSRETGKDTDTLVIEQSRLFAEQMIKRTPPKSLAQGRRAIANDLKKIFTVAEPPTIARAIEWSGGSGDNVKTYLTSKRTGLPFLIEWNKARLNPSNDEMAAHHNAHRTANGRVSTAGDNDRGIGRWIARDSMVVPKQAFNRYQRGVQEGVGRLKAGWVAMSRKFGAKRPAKWVDRHSSKRSAADLTGNKNKATMKLSNFAAGANRLGSTINSVLRIRVQAMRRQLVLIQKGYGKQFTRELRVRNRQRRAAR